MSVICSAGTMAFVLLNGKEKRSVGRRCSWRVRGIESKTGVKASSEEAEEVVE